MTNNQEIKKEPIQMDRGDVVQTPHIPYILPYHEFQSLTKIPSFLTIWAHTFLTGFGIFLVKIGAVIIEKKWFEGTSDISTAELITLGVLGALAVIFEFINFFVSSERKKMTKKIQNHFDTYEL